MKKRAKKSPLWPRRNAGSNKESTPVAKRNRGLTKKDVEPTIKLLRNLLSQDNFDDLSSDDDMVKGKRPGSNLHRTPSGASDSSTIDNKEEIKRSTLPVGAQPSSELWNEMGEVAAKQHLEKEHISPVYTRLLNRFGSQLNLSWLRVNALNRFSNQLT